MTMNFDPAAEPSSTTLPAELSPRAATLLRGAFTVFLWGVTLNVLAMLVLSLRWPILHDTPFMHYIAWIVSEGGRPYVDAFDMNFPGAYLIHWAIVALPGDMDLNWRGFDLLLTLVTLGLMARLMQPAGRRSQWLACVFFATVYLDGGPVFGGQRDMLMVPLQLAGMLALIRYFEQNSSEHPAAQTGWLALAGLLMGAACTIKPFGGALVGLQAIYLAVWSWRQDKLIRTAMGRCIVFGLASAVPMLGVLGWLYAIGSLPAFLDIQFNYLLPIYSQMDAGYFFRTYFVGNFLRGPLVLMVVLSVCTSVYHLGTRTVSPRLAVVMLAVAAALIHFLAQRKFWPYHSIPFFACASLLIFWDPGSLIWRRRGWDCCLAVAFALTLLIPASVRMGWKSIKEVRGVPDHQVKMERGQSLVQYLEPRLKPGDTVQVFGLTQGGIESLLRLKVRQPTRYIYDFHFVIHDPNLPYVQGMRRELMQQLNSNPPRFVVMFEQGLNVIGYDRLDGFEELTSWIRQNYSLSVEQNEYRVFERKPNANQSARSASWRVAEEVPAVSTATAAIPPLAGRDRLRLAGCCGARWELWRRPGIAAGRSGSPNIG